MSDIVLTPYQLYHGKNKLHLDDMMMPLLY
jgi:hypothetical protein